MYRVYKLCLTVHAMCVPQGSRETPARPAKGEGFSRMEIGRGTIEGIKEGGGGGGAKNEKVSLTIKMGRSFPNIE